MTRDNTPRAERPTPCATPGRCLSPDGSTASYCSKEISPSINSENLCIRAAESAETFNIDPYKREFAQVSRLIDVTIADTSLSEKLIDERFLGIYDRLDLLTDVIVFGTNGTTQIMTPENKNLLENGRLAYHVEARTLSAALGCYYHRALHNRDREPLPLSIMDTTHLKYVEILKDFEKGGLYADHPSLVAHARISIQSMALLSRLKDAAHFPQPALHHETSSDLPYLNHGAVIFPPTGEGKIPLTVDNGEYRELGRGKSSDHSRKVILAFGNAARHATVERKRITHRVSPRPTTHSEEPIYPYSDFDPEEQRQRRARPGASGQRYEDPIDTETIYVQDIPGTDGEDYLRKAIILEAHDEKKLTRHQKNTLKGASHLFRATIRQKYS